MGDRCEQHVLQVVGLPQRLCVLGDSRQLLNLASTALCLSCLILGPCEQLRCDGGRRQKRQQHDPVERLAHRQRVERHLEVVVDQQKTEEGERKPERAAAGGAATEDHQQVRDDHVRFLDFAAHSVHHHREDRQGCQPEGPRRGASHADAHGRSSNR